MNFEFAPLSAFGAIAITTTLLAGVTIWSTFLSGPKTFNYPIYGVEDEKPTELKRKFQHQADILLAEAYKKVITSTHTTWRITPSPLPDIARQCQLIYKRFN
jgi:hypothetical protein